MKVFFTILFIVGFLALLLGWFMAGTAGQVELARSQAEQAKYQSQVEIAQTQADLERSRLALQAELERTRAGLEQERLTLQAEIARSRQETWQEYAPVFVIVLLTIMIVVAGVVALAVVLAHLEGQRRTAAALPAPQATRLQIPGVLSEDRETWYVLAEPKQPRALLQPGKKVDHVHTR